jgi:hypothetical protein
VSESTALYAAADQPDDGTLGRLQPLGLWRNRAGRRPPTRDDHGACSAPRRASWLWPADSGWLPSGAGEEWHSEGGSSPLRKEQVGVPAAHRRPRPRQHRPRQIPMPRGPVRSPQPRVRSVNRSGAGRRRSAAPRAHCLPGRHRRATATVALRVQLSRPSRATSAAAPPGRAGSGRCRRDGASRRRSGR